VIKYILPFLVCGCSWETIGITSTKVHNIHVEEAENFMQDTVKNQSRIVEITHDISQEIIYMAKAKDDVPMIERAYTTSGKIKHAKEVSQELSRREFSKAPDPPFDMGAILQILMGCLGVGGPMGALILSQRGKIKDVAKQAISNGNSTEVNDTEHLKKYS